MAKLYNGAAKMNQREDQMRSPKKAQPKLVGVKLKISIKPTKKSPR